MKLSVSNIAWTSEYDEQMYLTMHNMGFSGLEIAPTRVFPEIPYDKNEAAKIWAEELKKTYGFMIPSMQSIWYGRAELLFGNEEGRESLFDYTLKAIDFAEAIGCKNLVFGCPRNRYLLEHADATIAEDFFRRIGEYAIAHNTVIGMEANPMIYNTNYINSTSEAIKLIEKVNSKGFLLNLDIGAMIENQEDIGVLNGKEHLINHVHISEPYLKAIKTRALHLQVADMLKDCGYKKYVSIEVGKQDNMDSIVKMMEYVRGVFAQGIGDNA